MLNRRIHTCKADALAALANASFRNPARGPEPVEVDLLYHGIVDALECGANAVELEGALCAMVARAGQGLIDTPQQRAAKMDKTKWPMRTVSREFNARHPEKPEIVAMLFHLPEKEFTVMDTMEILKLQAVRIAAACRSALSQRISHSVPESRL